MHLSRVHARGFALFELLLVSVLMSLLAVYVVMPQIVDSQKELRATNVAESMTSFQKLAATYFANNETAMRTAMSDGTEAGTYCRLGVDPAASDPATTGIVANNTTKRTCAIDVSVLKWKGIATGSLPDTNPYGQKWVAIFKLGTSTSTSDPPGVEMLTIGVTQVTGIASYAPDGWSQSDNDVLMKTARKLGATGGYIPDGDAGICNYTPATGKYEACSATGGWKVDVSSFVN